MIVGVVHTFIGVRVPIIHIGQLHTHTNMQF